MLTWKPAPSSTNGPPAAAGGRKTPCTIRMQELGIPDDMNGQPDYDGGGTWHAFDPRGRKGGGNTTGVVIDSGVLNPELLKGKKGGRIWPGMRLRDRIDSIIPHEYEELRHQGSHGEALK
ncbi:MAG: hypothetical protein ACHRXM_20110, partial [Isosphaerales bacterium]